MIELTKDLLIDAGGWAEMKKARKLHEDGAVEEAVYEKGELRGMVRLGGKMKRTRMVIRSATDMENFCSCPMVRRDGRICAHVLALGLEVLTPREVEKEKEEAVSDWPEVREDGEEVKLSVMLPLRVGVSWEKSQLMVGFGIEVDGEEKLLSEWPVDRVVKMDDQDAELWHVLGEIFPSRAPGVVSLSRGEFLQLLRGIAGHDRVWFGKKERAAVLPFFSDRGVLFQKGKKLAVRWPEEMEVLVDGGSAWALREGDFFPLVNGLPEEWQAVMDGGLLVAAEEAHWVVEGLSRWFEVDEDLLGALPKTMEPLVEIELEGSLRHLEARPIFHYGNKKLPPGEKRLLEGEGGESFLTDSLLEDEVLRVLGDWGFGEVNGKGVMVLDEREGILKFHAYGFDELKNRWVLTVGERFETAAEKVVAIRPRFDYQGSGEDWFSISMAYDAGGTEMTREEIQRLLNMGQSEKALGQGRVAFLDREQVEELGEVMSDCDPLQDSPGVMKLDARQSSYLREAATRMGVKTKAWPREAVAELGDRLDELGEVLRPYQREGVEWLWGVTELGMGAILADDMGLGKTLQTLAFIKARLSEKGGRALVVCPSSLVGNWLAEADKFVPELKAVAVVGKGRGEALKAKADIVVTSYAILRLDVDDFSNEDFEVIALDEAQQIKNPDSQVAKAACRLRGKHRVALTGTPLENSVRDLWSIMNFVLPGYLGSRKSFSERFEKPLRKAHDEGLAQRLSMRLKPVMKRRLKSEVAGDLPDKIEQVRYVEPTPKQRKIYQELLRESRMQVDAAEGGRKKMVALTALLRLRQACCDLRLLPGLEVEPGEAGGKMLELESLLQEAVTGGHRVLVFSQFVQLLQGVVPMLAENGWEFCYLDGQTKKRDEVVSRFQNEEVPIFLISLKAGGVGLNLTAADTVIHLDPWWNPAVEAQATDRAHRIGQSRTVNSYKLITKGTVEEKILALQEKKKKLISGTLGDGAALAAGLTEEEMAGLLES